MLKLFLLLTATSALSCDPTSVQNLVTTDVRSSVIRVSWSPLSANESLCVQEYEICSTSDDDSRSCLTVQNANNISEYAITGLQSCTQYNISVVTIGENNVTSEPVSLLANTAPRPINNMDVERKDDDTITVTWLFVFSSRRCLQQFELSLCDDQESNCTSTNVTARQFSLYTLDLPKKRECKDYVLNLVVLDANGQRSDNFRTIGEADVMGGPENLTLTNITSSSFEAEWAIPTSQENCKYMVYVNTSYRTEDFSIAVSTRYEYGITYQSVQSIPSCTACNFSVGFGQQKLFTLSAVVYTLPEGNTWFYNASVQEVTSSSIAVAWKSSQQNNQCIARYSVCWRKQSAGGVNCQNAGNDKNSLTLTGLQAKTEYQVSVTALLQSGTDFDNVTLSVSTKSGAAELVRNTLVSISAVVFCLLPLSI